MGFLLFYLKVFFKFLHLQDQENIQKSHPDLPETLPKAQ